LNYW